MRRKRTPDERGLILIIGGIPRWSGLAAALALVSATAFAVEEQPARRAEAVEAEKSEAKKPVKRDGRMEEKTTAPKVMLLRDWEELFGHKPMEEGTNMPEPRSGATKQETMKHMPKHDHLQEKY